MRLFAFLFCCSLLPSLPAQISNRKVLLIGIDGCRADVLRDANAPNIHGLLDHAVYSFDALTEAPTVSGHGWSSMLTGVRSDKHGVTDNTFAGANYGEYPDFITRAETFNPTLRTISICHWSPINDNLIQQCDTKENVGTDSLVNARAVHYLTNDDPDILYLDFDDVDHAGHSYGFDPGVPEYVAQVELTDGYVGQILAALQGRPNFAFENWLILVSTDHGGTPSGHGGASLEERNIFIICHREDLDPQEIQRNETVVAQPFGLYLNGADQYLQPADPDTFNFAHADFSIELRLKPDSLEGDAAFISNKDWDSGLSPGYVISTPFSDQSLWKVNVGDGTNRADISGGKIDDGQWHHLAATFDRDSALTIYQDGVRLGAVSMAAVGNLDAGLPLVIGQDGTHDYPFWYKGLLAEVRIWNTVLPEEVVRDFSCQDLTASHPFYDHLVAYWKMDADTGNEVPDASAAGNPLFATGADLEWTAAPGGFSCIDYDGTPRITDVAVSALTHLCIPIDSLWAMDGHSLVPDCSVTGLAAEQQAAEFRLSPNPAQEVLYLDMPGNGAFERSTVQVFNAQGGNVRRWEGLRGERQRLELKGLSPGWYSIQVVGEGGMRWLGRFVKL